MPGQMPVREVVSLQFFETPSLQVACLNNKGANVLGAASDEKFLRDLDLLEVLLLLIPSVLVAFDFESSDR